MLVPKLFTTLQTYSRDQFLADLIHAQPLAALEGSGLLDGVGKEHVCDNVDDALAAARKHLGLPAEES